MSGLTSSSLLRGLSGLLALLALLLTLLLLVVGLLRLVIVLLRLIVILLCRLRVAFFRALLKGECDFLVSRCAGTFFIHLFACFTTGDRLCPATSCTCSKQVRCHGERWAKGIEDGRASRAAASGSATTGCTAFQLDCLLNETAAGFLFRLDVTGDLALFVRDNTVPVLICV